MSDPMGAEVKPWVVHICANYPLPAFGWSVVYWQTTDDVGSVLGGNGERASQELTDMILAAEVAYHERIGPACDDFVVTVWGFDSIEEMFTTCGSHLLSTAPYMRDWAYP